MADRQGIGVPEELASVERAITEIWCEVLEIPSCDPEEDFTASGGDSVQLLALLARVKDEFGVELSLLAFLKEPTIASIVDRVESERQLA